MKYAAFGCTVAAYTPCGTAAIITGDHPGLLALKFIVISLELISSITGTILKLYSLHYISVQRKNMMREQREANQEIEAGGYVRLNDKGERVV